MSALPEAYSRRAEVHGSLCTCPSGGGVVSILSQGEESKQRFTRREQPALEDGYSFGTQWRWASWELLEDSWSVPLEVLNRRSQENVHPSPRTLTGRPTYRRPLLPGTCRHWAGTLSSAWHTNSAEHTRFPSSEKRQNTALHPLLCLPQP